MAFNKNEAFPSSHVAITPSDSADLSREMLIYVNVTGDVRVSDDGGNILTYLAVPAGVTLPIVATRVYATGTTATVFGVY
jgi:hypothetical protein